MPYTRRGITPGCARRILRLTGRNWTNTMPTWPGDARKIQWLLDSRYWTQGLGAEKNEDPANYAKDLERTRLYHAANKQKERFRFLLSMRYWTRRYAWFRENLPWKTHRPVYYSKRVEHYCEGCTWRVMGGAICGGSRFSRHQQQRPKVGCATAVTFQKQTAAKPCPKAMRVLPLSRRLPKEELNWVMVHDHQPTIAMFKGTVRQKSWNSKSQATSSNAQTMLEFPSTLATL